MAKRPTEDEQRQRYLMSIDPRLRPMRDRRGWLNNASRPAVDRALEKVHDEDPDAYHEAHSSDPATCTVCLHRRSVVMRQLAEDEEQPDRPIMMQIRDMLRDG